MKLAILLLLFIAVSALARPQNDDSDNRSGLSESIGNSGESGGELEVRALLNTIFEYLSSIFGKEITGRIETVIEPLIDLPVGAAINTVTGVVKNNPLIKTIQSIPILSGALSSVTSLFSTPVKIIEFVKYILSTVFSKVTTLIL